MPANLTPEYRRAEKEYRAAKTREERLACLEVMLRVIPKHKGTDHMQGDLRRRIAKLRAEGRKEGARSKRAPVFKVEKEGAGQLVLVGGPNTGKSSLVGALTNAHVSVAAYPFSTQVPQPGMARYEDVQIQVVDTPPITADYMEVWMPDTVRRGDGVLVVADAGDDGVVEGIEAVLGRLSGVKITLGGEAEANLTEVTRTYRRAAIVANKADLPGAGERVEIVREFYDGRFEIWPVSATRGDGLEAMQRKMYEFLRIMRVYTKQPGRGADMGEPYTVPIGTTVLGMAVKVHREFEQSLKSARVWGSGKYDGIHVKRDHVLCEGDIVELQE